MILGLNKKTLTQKIDAHLDKERQFILRGDVSRLDAMIEERERMVEALAKTAGADCETDTTEIEALQIKARRNASLIQAAIKGIKDANERVAEIEAAHSRLSTYSAQGLVSNVACQKTTVIKKA